MIASNKTHHWVTEVRTVHINHRSDRKIFSSSTRSRLCRLRHWLTNDSFVLNETLLRLVAGEKRKPYRNFVSIWRTISTRRNRRGVSNILQSIVRHPVASDENRTLGINNNNKQQQRRQSHAPAFSVYLSLRIWQSENSLLRLFSPMLKGISSVHIHTK